MTKLTDEQIKNLREQSASREMGPCGKHSKMFQELLHMADNLDEGPQLYFCTLCAEKQAERAAVLTELVAHVEHHDLWKHHHTDSIPDVLNAIREFTTDRFALDRYVEEKVREGRRQMQTLLVEAAIPLEALRLSATARHGDFLTPELHEAIITVTDKIRASVPADKEPQ